MAGLSPRIIRFCSTKRTMDWRSSPRRSADDMIHGFGQREILLIIQGRHRFVSPSWYAPGATRAPTWNFSVAHCYGVPQILGEDENLAVLARLVAHFERD